MKKLLVIFVDGDTSTQWDVEYKLSDEEDVVEFLKSKQKKLNDKVEGTDFKPAQILEAYIIDTTFEIYASGTDIKNIGVKKHPSEKIKSLIKGFEHWHDMDYWGTSKYLICKFCEGHIKMIKREDFEHEKDCPVLIAQKMADEMGVS
jgi:hypothetical protein